MITLFVHIVTRFIPALIFAGSVMNHWVKMPAGMKYMFAIECSSPLETKAMIGTRHRRT